MPLLLALTSAAAPPIPIPVYAIYPRPRPLFVKRGRSTWVPPPSVAVANPPFVDMRALRRVMKLRQPHGRSADIPLIQAAPPPLLWVPQPSRRARLAVTSRRARSTPPIIEQARPVTIIGSPRRRPPLRRKPSTTHTVPSQGAPTPTTAPPRRRGFRARIARIFGRPSGSNIFVDPQPWGIILNGGGPAVDNETGIAILPAVGTSSLNETGASTVTETKSVTIDETGTAAGAAGGTATIDQTGKATINEKGQP